VVDSFYPKVVRRRLANKGKGPGTWSLTSENAGSVPDVMRARLQIPGGVGHDEREMGTPQLGTRVGTRIKQKISHPFIRSRSAEAPRE